MSLISGLVGSLLSSGTSMVSTLFGGLVSRLRAGFTSMFSNLAQMLSSGLSLALRAPLGLLTGLGRVLGGVLTGGLVAATGAVAGLVGILGRAVSTTTTWGRSVATLSASTGLGARVSGVVQSRFGALGLDASQVLAGQNPQLYGMRASAFGVRGSYTSPDFLASAAGRFQSLNSQGMLGNIMAQNMAKSLGLGDAAGLRVLNTPVRQIREQQRYASGVRQSLGLDDSSLVSVSRQWDLLTGKMRIFGESVLMKIAQSALPRINAGFDKIMQFAESRAGGLGGLIERGVDVGFKAFGRLTLFLADTAPKAALGFASTMLKGLLAVTQAVPTLWSGLLKGVDIAQAGFNFIAQTGASAFDLLTRGISAVSAGVGAFVQHLPQIGTMLGGVWDSIRYGINGLVPGLLPGGESPNGGGGLGQAGRLNLPIPGLSNPNASPYTSPGGLLGGLWNASRALTAPGGWVGRQVGHAFGADDGLSQTGFDLAGRYVGGRALLAGGRALMGTPAAPWIAATGLAVGAAGAVGYGAFSGAQKLGLVDRDQSFAERLGLGASRVADFVTGNWGETDRRANTQWAHDRAQGQALGQRPGTPPGLPAMPRSPLTAIRDATLAGWSNPTPLGSMGSGIFDAMRSGFDSVPRGSWSQNLDSRFGPSLRDGSTSATERIQGGLRDLEQMRKGLDNSEILALLRELVNVSQGIRSNTGRSNTPSVFTEQQLRQMGELVRTAERRMSEGEWLGNFQAQ